MSNELTPFRNLRGEPVLRIGEIHPRLARQFEREFALPHWHEEREPAPDRRPRKRKRR